MHTKITISKAIYSALFSAAILFATSSAFAQVKIGTSPTVISPNANLDVEDNAGGHMVVLNNGNVGIGIAAPVIKLNVENGNFSVNQGADNGFTAGIQASASIGNGNSNRASYSFTAGQNNVTDGQNSMAIGIENFTGATATGAFSFGQGNQSRAANAISGGLNSLASGANSISVGQNNQSTANGATSFGMANFAYGEGSFSVGMSNQATGAASIAMGFLNLASGNTATAIGRQAKSTHAGGTVIADGLGADLYSFGDNTMTMRFIGGYRNYSNGAHTTGVYLAANATSWASISDLRAKKDISALENGLATIMKLKPKNTIIKTQTISFIH